MLADQWLSADSSVKDSDKFVILLTDGKSYIWNNDEGKATTIYSQWYRHYAIQGNGFPVSPQNFLYDKYDYPDVLNAGLAPALLTEYNARLVRFVDGENKANYEALFASDNTELSGSTDFDTVIDWTKPVWSSLLGNVPPYDIKDAANLFYSFSGCNKYCDFVSAEAGVRWLEGNFLEEKRDAEGKLTLKSGQVVCDPPALNNDFYMFPCKQS